MNKVCLFCCFVFSPFLGAESSEKHPQALVIPHETLKTFTGFGNHLTGIATPGLGAQQFEVWRAQIAPGSRTPRHKHDCEEIVIFLRGKGVAVTEFEELEFEAPCTLILPAGVYHEIINTGDEPTDHIDILGTHSEIVDMLEQPMLLPWRK